MTTTPNPWTQPTALDRTEATTARLAEVDNVAAHAASRARANIDAGYTDGEIDGTAGRQHRDTQDMQSDYRHGYVLGYQEAIALRVQALRAHIAAVSADAQEEIDTLLALVAQVTR